MEQHGKIQSLPGALGAAEGPECVPGKLARAPGSPEAAPTLLLGSWAQGEMEQRVPTSSVHTGEGAWVLVQRVETME